MLWLRCLYTSGTGEQMKKETTKLYHLHIQNRQLTAATDILFFALFWPVTTPLHYTHSTNEGVQVL